MMKIIYLILIVCVCFTSLYKCKLQNQNQNEFDDDEFSEFDSIDEDTTKTKKTTQPATASNMHQNQESFSSSSFDETIEDDFETDETPKTTQKPRVNQSTQKPSKAQNDQDLDSEEFEHFVEDEEFENFESKQTTQTAKKQSSSSSSQNQVPNLKIANVPTHLLSSNNWSNYVYELVMIAVILVYLFVYLYGKSKNYKLVNAWYQSNRDLLQRNFALVGDDGTSTELPSSDSVDSGVLIKESENSYGLWCSGRSACDGLLIQLKMIKRQDLINGLLMQMFKPQTDQIVFSVEYSNKDDLDPFVFCLTNKKLSQQMFNDYQDLSSYCVEKKLNSASSSGSTTYSNLMSTSVSNKYVLLNELGEVPSLIMNDKLCSFLNKYPDMVEYIFISDQYVGLKTQLSNEEQSSSVNTNETALGLPKSRSVLIVCFNVPGKGTNTSVQDMESMIPALQLALYLVDKVPRLRLSKEAKDKSIRNRKTISEQYMKLTHKQRQEAAMLRKEEKRRAEKEKIMNESDPEKQKKLEEKELKREKKKNLSKMKQIKIKSM